LQASELQVSTAHAMEHIVSVIGVVSPMAAKSVSVRTMQPATGVRSKASDTV
jgi:hypothetical protein